ncbi:fibronectin type III domain-containing protein [Actinotalea sp. M2MS4P-6]|uniref:Ig-like domain-containing protein n=1 Tax=Actinotalea sp. M2MS4P-6 TaxID=2983762 RepID=UPI0021E402DF|nr:fibronectin type III domain-containing protein [Actinotalea sp. M2MS4P-6]MCV2395616.1 fibronectin type III domain-containing protein [Actinotalea sp. M2MS4P-6]
MSRSAPRGRRWPSTVGAVVAPAVLVGLALVYPGASVSQVDLDDGAVWVTNAAELKLGRWNPAVSELNAGLLATSTALDVWQDGDAVLLVEPGRIAAVDTASVSAPQSVTVTGEVDVTMARGVVSEMADDGRLWVRTLDDLAEVATDVPGDVDLGPGASAVVSADSGAVLATTSAGELHRIELAGGQVQDRTIGALAGEMRTADQVTAVGDSLVALTGTTLHTSQATVDLASYGTDLVLQQPGPIADDVLVATANGDLLEVPLAGGNVVEHATPYAGEPAAPVLVAGCANSAWAGGQGGYLQVCGSRTVERDLERISATQRVVFRVNRDVVVLNSVADGLVWVPTEDDMVREPNWPDIAEQSDPGDGQESNEQPSTQVLQAECTDQTREARAVPDSYGVRPGRTTILSVIDNDAASDCGILVIREFDELPASFGTVVPIYGGRALQLVTTADATGTATFTYTVSDGRNEGAPSTATVTLTIRSDGENEAPVQVHPGSVQAELGASVTYDVLPDFMDPEGDQLVLLSATVDGGGTVSSRQDGDLTFFSDGTTLGTRTVELVVSDGELVAGGTLSIDVRPAGTLVPLIDPVHAVTYVGQPVTVSPLDFVRSSSREPVRLAGVDDVPSATISTDLEAGTFTFQAVNAGTYYVSFVITAAPQQATGIARIDVKELPETRPKPIAVLDVALLPPDGEVVLDPLANDVDPGGNVLVLQSVQVPEDSGLEVAILGHQLVRISAVRVLEHAVTVPYTISNGYESTTGELRVKPIDAATGQQPPVVPPVSVTVRTGGVVTIPVLDDAYDPDGDSITLNPVLPATLPADQGLLFVSGDVLRYQAPSTPMTVQATFEVVDQYRNASAGTVTVTVHASDATSKSLPRPKDLTARMFEEETIRIPIPLTGIDADGDGVTLLGIDTAPSKGIVQNQGADWIEYTALPGESGTDEFTYAVEDWVGQRAVATIRVGIAARPSTSAEVVARNDEVTVRPGRSVEVRVLANDVDMSGGDLHLADQLDVPEGVDARIEGRRIVVQTPQDEGTLQIAYTALNDRGGQDSAVLTVTVSADATISPPVARDVVVPASETLNATSVEVNVLEVAENPSGPLTDLQVSVHPSVADIAQVTPTGTVVVTLGPNPRTLPYLLTNTAPDANGVSAYAFITVPALGDFPPVRRPNVADLQVLAGSSLTIKLGEQIQVAPGRSPRIADVTAVSATKSDGPVVVVDRETLVYTPLKSYAGPASVTVEVADGVPGSAGVRTAVITLPITVLAFEDHPPRFVPSVLDVGPGDTVNVDLSAFVVAPVGIGGSDVSAYTYALTTAVPAGFGVVLNGSQLTLTADATTPRGSVGSIGLAIDYGGLAPLPAEVDFRVVASQRPLARVNDVFRSDGVAGRSTTVQLLTGAFNPFPGSRLSVVDATVESGDGQVDAFDSSSVTIRPDPGFVGPLVVRFRVADVTGDLDRQVEGRVTLVVRDRPAAPAAPRIVQVGDTTVQLAWDAPTSNGEPITGYRVTASPGGTVTDCPTTTCTITGLTNDTEYTFTVIARNVVGDSDPSPASGPARPDVRPAAPAAASLAWGDARVTATWTAPTNTGSPIREYQVEISPAPPTGPAVVSTASTSYTFTGLANGTAYIVRVRALNDAPDPGDWSAWSASQVPAGVPGAPDPVTATTSSVGSGARQITVQWAAAAPNGDPVSRYDVRIDGTVVEVPGTSLSYTFDADRGRTYTIEVRGANKAGVSAWVSTTGEIWSSPAAVTGLTVTDAAANPTPFGQGAVRATWTAPTDTGGVALSGYRVSIDGRDPVVTTQTTYLFTGLQGGSHSVSVVAVNVKDATSAAVTVEGTTVTVPQAPTVTDPADVSVPLEVTFRWTAGGTGGSPITSYRYVVTDETDAIVDTRTVSASRLSVTVSADAGAVLTIEVHAINAEGESLASNLVQAEVPDGPAPPPGGGAGGGGG